MIPEAKLEPFGDTELDKRRAKGDSKGVAATLNLNLPSSDSPPRTSSNPKDDTDDEDDRSENCPNHNGGIIESIAQKLKPGLDHDSDELEAILTVMIKNDQKLTFVEEYESFKEGKEVSKSSTISSLSPFMDPSGGIKMKTRLEYCDILPEQARYPVILAHPNKSRLAELLIIEGHLKLCHGGPEVVRRRLRNLYWILGGKKAISSILHKCPHQKCAGSRLKPIIQNPPPLPPEGMNTSMYLNL